MFRLFWALFRETSEVSLKMTSEIPLKMAQKGRNM
jgi:hypothetical protein